ncbi:MAG: hypothetical protein KJT03_04205 [Verrucomicrobiae bacterium]|nr:hypothetical protein [Verrucomicrobiae bacterium]
MPKSPDFIGFRAGLLGDKPLRLDLLANEKDWFALHKPSGIPGQAHPWYAGKMDVSAALRLQLEEGKEELKRLQIPQSHYICGPDLEVPGPVIFAKNKTMADRFKNALGSDQLEFRFLFVSGGQISHSELECHLPLALHREKPLALVSHRTGKKSLTRYRLLAKIPYLSLWEAVTTFPRMHQIRLHAAECGISIKDDILYGNTTSDEQQNHRIANRLPVFSGFSLCLQSVDLGQCVPGFPVVCAEFPKRFEAFLKKCGFSESAWKTCQK